MRSLSFAGFAAIIFATILFVFHASAEVPVNAPTPQAQDATLTMAVPDWKVGDWWVVHQANTFAKFSNYGADFALRDSNTDFTTLRFEVVGVKQIKNPGFDQSPIYDCSEVKVTESDPHASANLTKHYLLYYGKLDLVLRRIVRYYSDSRGKVQKQTQEVGPGSLYTIQSGLSFIAETPQFPLATVESIVLNGRRVRAFKAELRQSANDISEATTQHWVPGMLWWHQADRGGLHTSVLVESSRGN